VREKILVLDNKTTFEGNKFTLHKAELDITWVRESYAFMALSWKGHQVRRFSTHSDFYGFLSSAGNQFDEAPEVAESWKIQQSSELELHVIGFLQDAPTLGFSEEEYGRKYYKPAKRNEDELWFDDESVVDGASFNFKEFPLEIRRMLRTIDHSPTVVWNSAWQHEANIDALLRYRALATATERVVGKTDYRFHD
jgi:hypothetical protein